MVKKEKYFEGGTKILEKSYKKSLFISISLAKPVDLSQIPKSERKKLTAKSSGWFAGYSYRKEIRKNICRIFEKGWYFIRYFIWFLVSLKVGFSISNASLATGGDVLIMLELIRRWLFGNQSRQWTRLEWILLRKRNSLQLLRNNAASRVVQDAYNCSWNYG